MNEYGKWDGGEFYEHVWNSAMNFIRKNPLATDEEVLKKSNKMFKRHQHVSGMKNKKKDIYIKRYKFWCDKFRLKELPVLKKERIRLKKKRIRL
jgi:hypothetical protein